LARQGAFDMTHWMEFVELAHSRTAHVVKPHTKVHTAVYLVQVLIEVQDQASSKNTLVPKEDARELLPYFASLLSHLSSSGFRLVLLSVHEAARGAMLQGSGDQFMLSLRQTLATYNVPTVLSTEDALTFLRHGGPAEKHASPAVEVEEWAKELAKQIVLPKVSNDEEAFESIWLAAGGNGALLRKLVERVSTARVQQARVERQAERETDEEKRLRELGEDPTVTTERKTTKMEDALLDVNEQDLGEEVVRFEWAMNQVLASPAMLDFRSSLNNEAHFQVLLCETIRELCKKPHVAARDPSSLLDITHPILIALLDANLLYPRFQPFPRLTIVSTLHRRLLLSFCDNQYRQLSGRERVEYNVNLWLQRKKIFHALQNMEL